VMVHFIPIGAAANRKKATITEHAKGFLVACDNDGAKGR